MTLHKNTNLTDVLFPVERRAVYLRHGEDPSLFDSDPADEERFVSLDGFDAIIDVERERTFAVVRGDYSLVTNEEAIELGERCFRSIFGQDTIEGMELFNIIMPRTRSFCHIDYIHSSINIEPWPDDRWMLYLRVTNSYNRTKLLRFDLGFCRAICLNGIIFEDRSIRLKYAHTRGQIDSVRFETMYGSLVEFERMFVEELHKLKGVPVPESMMLGLACKVFDLRIAETDLDHPGKRERLHELRDRMRDLTHRYFSDLGPNGYAALNVLTDFASDPGFYISPETMVDRLQKKAGLWVTSFLEAVEKPEFNFDRFVGEYARVAEVLQS
jgi:hypothetical protein